MFARRREVAGPYRRDKNKLDAVVVLTKTVTADAAVTNVAMVAAEQESLIASRGPGKFRLHIDARAMCHQAALLTKPFYGNMGAYRRRARG